MIIRVSKDLENGAWGDDGFFTGEVTYAVITDSSDGLSLFYDRDVLTEHSLPLRGSVYAPGLFVKNVSFDRREDKNFRDNGHFGGAGSGVYTIWDYVVSISSDPNFSSGDNSDDNSSNETPRDYPDSFSIAPKFYEVYDEKHYKTSDVIGKPTAIVRDKSGMPMPSSRQLVNPVITFTYKTRNFKMRYLDLALFTVNKEAITVCGIDLPAYAGKIVNLSANKDASSDKFTVTCELEIGVQKNVYIEELISKGFYAKFKSGEKAIRIQKANTIASAKEKNSEDAVKKGLAPGQYANSVYGNWGETSNELNTEDPITHDKNGLPYLGEGIDLSEAKENGDIGVIEKRISVGASWKALDFPKKGFKD